MMNINMMMMIMMMVVVDDHSDSKGERDCMQICM